MAEVQTDNNGAIKKALADKKAILGTKRTLKALRVNGVNTVYITRNAPEELKATIDYYSSLNNVSIVHIDQDNEELGLLCRKPFLISVLSVAK